MCFSKGYIHISTSAKIIFNTAYDSYVGFDYLSYFGQCDTYRNNPVGVMSTKVTKGSIVTFTVSSYLAKKCQCKYYLKTDVISKMSVVGFNMFCTYRTCKV